MDIPNIEPKFHIKERLVGVGTKKINFLIFETSHWSNFLKKLS